MASMQCKLEALAHCISPARLWHVNRIATVALLALLCLFSTACDSPAHTTVEGQKNIEKNDFYVRAGLSAAEYDRKNRSHKSKIVDQQAAGINFYQHRWSVTQPGTVYVDNAQYSFKIYQAISVTGVENLDYADNGIYEFSVNSGLSAEEKITHDQACQLFMQYLQNLVKIGWTPYLRFYSDPRLTGKQSFQYAIKDALYAPDPNYTPSLPEWMALGDSHAWVLHANDVFLEVGFNREHSDTDKELSAYLLKIQIRTKDEHARNEFANEQRHRWKSLWSENLKIQKNRRYQTEAELIRQAYSINTQYLDPVIHPDDPVEPNNPEAKAWLQYIKANNPRK